jgi:hypothetical protein
MRIENRPATMTSASCVNGSAAKPPISAQLREPTRARSSNHSLAKSHSNGAAITDDTSHNSAGSVAGAITTRIPDTT